MLDAWWELFQWISENFDLLVALEEKPEINNGGL